jgi:hemoglobin
MNYWNKLKDKIFKKKEPKFLYEVIGEEKGVYELVKNFYEIMESDPNAKECLDIHELHDGVVPDEVKKKFFMFLCGWFGGPNLYVERIGPPRMRARHMHVKITTALKDQWLYCMFKALDIHPYKIRQDDRYRFEGSFKALASRIVNA